MQHHGHGHGPVQPRRVLGLKSAFPCLGLNYPASDSISLATAHCPILSTDFLRPKPQSRPRPATQNSWSILVEYLIPNFRGYTTTTSHHEARNFCPCCFPLSISPRASSSSPALQLWHSLSSFSAYCEIGTASQSTSDYRQHHHQLVSTLTHSLLAHWTAQNGVLHGD